MIAFCLGSAACVFDDWHSALAIATPDIVIGVNRIARDWNNPLDAWVSYHPEHLSTWMSERRDEGLPDHRSYWTCERRTGVIDWNPPNGETLNVHLPVSGSSGLGAVEVALTHFGADRVILCGIPMSATPHYNSYAEDVPKQWDECARYHRFWRAYPEEKRAKVRSMSGWTRELLGGK